MAASRTTGSSDVTSAETACSGVETAKVVVSATTPDAVVGGTVAAVVWEIVVADGRIEGRGEEVVLFGDVVETAELLDGVNNTVEDDEDVVVDGSVEADEDDGLSVVVVLCSVEVVDSGRVVFDVVVVSSGCVVVVLDDIVEDSVVVGKSLNVVVGHTSTVLLVVSCITVVDTGTVSSIVVLVSVDEVVASTVVVGSGSVDVVVLVVLVAADVVGRDSETDVSRSYSTPDHQASGFPQHTPALSRYQPGCTSIEMWDCRPYQSSLAASSMPDVS